MRRLFAILLLVSATAATAVPRLSEEDSRRALADYARCAAAEQPELASRAVVEEWSGGALSDKGRTMLEGDCLRAAGLVSRMRFRAENLRAALAEQLIRGDPSLAPDPAQLAILAPLNYHLPWPVRTVDGKGRPLKAKAIQAQTEAFNQRAGIIAGQHVAECVVKANPHGVRAVFTTKVASKEETAALSAIGGQFAPCIPAGKQMSFDRNSLRGILALAYYRLAMAARGIVWNGEPVVAARERD